MTGVWIMSDLHVDTALFELPEIPAGAEVLVIVGDIGDGHHKAIRWLQQHAVPMGLPIVYVAGNHDYFAGDLFDDCVEHYERIGINLLHVHRPAVEIAGVRFVGSTLWTDYAVGGDIAAALWWAKQTMPDFLNVDVGMRRMRPRDLADVHRLQLAGIERELAQQFDGPTVVVTHHAPHPTSLRGGAASGPADASWASDLTSVIERHRPAAWIHGHVHESRDYIVGPDDGGTRIICNPRGYLPPGNPEFRNDLVIEIESHEFGIPVP